MINSKAEQALAARVRYLREGKGGPWFKQPRSKQTRKQLLSRINESFGSDAEPAMKAVSLENIETGRKSLSFIEAVRISIALDIPLLEILIDPYDPFAMNTIIPELGLTNLEIYRMQRVQSPFDDAYLYADRLLDALESLEESNMSLPPTKTPKIPVSKDKKRLFQYGMKNIQPQCDKKNGIISPSALEDYVRKISQVSTASQTLHKLLMEGEGPESIRERERSFISEICRNVHQLAYYGYHIPDNWLRRIKQAIQVSERKWNRPDEMSALEDMEVRQDFEMVKER